MNVTTSTIAAGCSALQAAMTLSSTAAGLGETLMQYIVSEAIHGVS